MSPLLTGAIVGWIEVPTRIVGFCLTLLNARIARRVKNPVAHAER